MRDPSDAGIAAAARCPNCGAAAAGAFCAACGQAQGAAAIPLRQWLADFIDDVFAVNARLPRTLRALVIRPGLLTEEWLRGRRGQYIAPFRLYLLCSVVMFTVSLLPIFSAQFAPDTGRVVLIDPLLVARFESLGAQLRATAPQVLFVLVPLFALFVQLLARRSGSYYIEHLIFALHVHSFGFLVMSVSWILDIASDPLAWILQAPFLLWLPAYVALALRSVYEQSLLRATLKTIVLLGAYITLVAVSVIGVAEWRARGPDEQLAEARELYFDVVAAERAGDTSRFRRLLPQAILAHQRLEEHLVGAHMRYHLGNLLLKAGEQQRAHVQAQHALVSAPGDLLVLGLAARCAEARGESALAAEYYRRLIDAAAERGAAKGHEQELVEYLGEAREKLSRGDAERQRE